MRSASLLPSMNVRSLPSLCVWGSLVFVMALAASVLRLPAQAPNSTTQARHAARSGQSHPKPSPEVPEPAPTPQPPNWPANDRPAAAQVAWDAGGLRIHAVNSSLQQILQQVASATGTKVDGMGLTQDQRVFGEFGPGQARDVIAQLLQGSGYNFLLVGDLGRGAPRQVVLSSRRSTTSMPTARPAQEDNEDDSVDNNEVDTQPQPPPAPVPQPPTPGIGPDGQPIRTPQQLMQEIQQRQQQMQQQQQQPGTPPNQ